MSSAKVPRPSGTCAMPSFATASGPRRPSGLPSKQDLAAPLAPCPRSRAASSSCRRRSRRGRRRSRPRRRRARRRAAPAPARSAPRRRAARAAPRLLALARRVVGAEVGLDHGRVRAHLGRRARRRSSCRSSSTCTWSEIPITRFMWCSTRSTVSFAVVADLLDEAPELRDLLVVEPAGRLVEQQQLRRARRARARARPASASRTAARRPAAARSRRARRSRAPRAPRPRRCAPRVCAPTRTLSSTVIVLKSSTFWNVRAIPRRTIPCTRRLQQVSPSKRDLALVRRVEPRDHVERRRLAGAVRADQADDLALRRRRTRPRRGRRSRRTGE